MGSNVCTLRICRGIFYGRDGQPSRAIAIIIDFTERKLAEEMLVERNLQLEVAGRVGLVGSYAYDVQTERLQISPGFAAIYGFPSGTTEITYGAWLAYVHAEDVDGLQALGSVHPDDLAHFDELCRQIYESRRRDFTFDYRIIRADGEIRWIESRRFVSYGTKGQPRRIVGINIDVTDRNDVEHHQNTLIFELDHRVKNILAIASTLAARTQGTSSAMAEFVAALDGRIKSMATTHELLSNRRWQGIPLAEIVRRELAPYASAGNAGIDGPDVVLSAEASPDARHGVPRALYQCREVRRAFSRNRLCIGTPELGAQRTNRKQAAHSREESGGPQVMPRIRSGFGTSVVREMVPYELDGTVDYVLAPDGVVCMLEIPTRWLSSSDQEGQREGDTMP
jgi:two-component sensor histidine kinase